MEETTKWGAGHPKPTRSETLALLWNFPFVLFPERSGIVSDPVSDRGRPITAAWPKAPVLLFEQWSKRPERNWMNLMKESWLYSLKNDRCKGSYKQIHVLHKTLTHSPIRTIHPPIFRCSVRQSGQATARRTEMNQFDLMAKVIVVHPVNPRFVGQQEFLVQQTRHIDQWTSPGMGSFSDCGFRTLGTPQLQAPASHRGRLQLLAVPSSDSLRCVTRPRNSPV